MAEGQKSKVNHPYPKMNPVPLSCDFTVRHQWAKFFPNELPLGYDYRISKNDKGNFPVNFATFISSKPPPDTFKALPGDIWVCEANQKGVWICQSEFQWGKWKGNNVNYKHPVFDDYTLWFNGGFWNWVKMTSMRSQRLRWTGGSRGGGKWAKENGRRTVVDGKEKAILPSGRQTVEQWLSVGGTLSSGCGRGHSSKRKATSQDKDEDEDEEEGEDGSDQSASHKRLRTISPQAFGHSPHIQAGPSRVEPTAAVLPGHRASIEVATMIAMPSMSLDPNCMQPALVPALTSFGPSTGMETIATAPIVSLERNRDFNPSAMALRQSAPFLSSPNPSFSWFNAITPPPHLESANDANDPQSQSFEPSYNEAGTVGLTPASVVEEPFPLSAEFDPYSDIFTWLNNYGEIAAHDASIHDSIKEGPTSAHTPAQSGSADVHLHVLPGECSNPGDGHGTVSRSPAKSQQSSSANNTAAYVPVETIGRSEAYPELPSRCCLGDREGREWPKGTETISWWNGLETILPFVGGQDGKETHDTRAVKKMAAGCDAFEDDGFESPVMLVKLEDYTSGVSGLTSDTGFLDEKEILSRIEAGLSGGKSVLVVPWKADGPRMTFHEESISSSRGAEDQDRLLQWTCATLRAKTMERTDAVLLEGPPAIHRATTLRKFLELADEPTTCGNLSNVLSNEGDIPWFIRRISRDALAWRTTSPSAHSSGAAVPISENVVPIRPWQCLTMAGFYSGMSHDPDGLCTWITIHNGAKLWCIREPRNEQLQDDSLTELRDLHKAAMDTDILQTVDREKYTSAHNLLLCEGSVLITPPGKWREVYTPVKTIAHGGHFLTYRTMHLTQFARWFDHDLGLESGNTEQLGILRNLCRMVIALLYLEESVSRRQFLALAHMVMEHEAYVARVPPDHACPTPSLSPEYTEERRRALCVIQAIMQANEISQDEINNESLRGGHKWEYADGDCIIIPVLEDMKLELETPVEG